MLYYPLSIINDFAHDEPSLHMTAAFHALPAHVPHHSLPLVLLTIPLCLTHHPCNICLLAVAMVVAVLPG